jgi:cytochrome c-type biogenesis protein CcmF
MLLNGLSLLIKWRKSDTQEVIKKSTYSAIGAVIFTLILVIFGGVSELLIIFLSLTTAFALFVNLDIAIKIVRGNMKMLGAYLAHIGIALFILGVIGSAVYSEQIDVDLEKNKTIKAFDYELTFTDIFMIENNTKYAFNVNIKRGNSEYKLSPIMYISDFNNSLVREPAILTLPTRDLYLSPLGYDEGTNSSGKQGSVALEKGGSTEFNGARITFEQFDLSSETIEAMQQGKDFQMGAILSVEKDGKKENVELFRKVKGGNIELTSFESKEMDIKIQLANLTAGKIELVIESLNNNSNSDMQISGKEVLTVTASIKPFINLVWIGVVVLVVGFFVSMARRLKESMIVS